VNADADMDLFSWLFLCVVTAQLRLNLLGTLHGMDDRGEVHQEGIADGLDDGAVMDTYCLLDELVMGVQPLEGTRFISAHLAAKARDVGEHDRGELTSLGLRHRMVPSLSERLLLSVRRMPAYTDPISSSVKNHLVVHIQGNHSHTPNSCQTDDTDTRHIPHEMLSPHVPPGMKKRRHFPRERIDQHCR
jgi:hypothetical protein